MENINNYVSSKIKEFREQKGITQQELAEALHTTQQSIARYENGERKADQNVLFALADYFKISINKFFPEMNMYGDEHISDDMGTEYISATQLSIMTGITLNDLNEIINKKNPFPKPSILFKIANALNKNYYDYFIAYGYIEDPEDEKNELFNTGIRYMLNKQDRLDLCKYLSIYWNKTTKTNKFTIDNIYKTLFPEDEEKNKKEIIESYDNLHAKGYTDEWINQRIRNIYFHYPKQQDEVEALFSMNKDILTEEDKEYIKFIIEKRKREIDKQLGEDDAS